MSYRDFDAIVLGAGMIGVCSAVRLQESGKSVLLIDRNGPGEGTSFGNAGIVQRETADRFAFPRDLRDIVRHGLNRSTQAHIHWAALPWLAPILYRYWRQSEPRRLEHTVTAMWALTKDCLTEHEAMMAAANAAGLVRHTGYLRLFRQSKALQAALQKEEKAHAIFGCPFELRDAKGVRELEPDLAGAYAGGIWLTDMMSVSDPGGLVKAYAALFETLGGAYLRADVSGITESGGLWEIRAGGAIVRAPDIVIAAGPWSARLLAKLGARFPLGAKRGYHMHFAKIANHRLSRPVLDVETGFVITDMKAGVRLTTGAEFAFVDSPATPVQLERVEPVARKLFPLGRRLDAKPWLGARPYLPDLLPAIGRVPGRKGLWANFGHHHLGFTLGPTSARLLAEMMTGKDTFIDPRPYRPERFV